MDSVNLYNKTADLWARKNPNSLSDFTARPFIFEMAGSLNGAVVGDFGCGEGYCSRVFVKMGAAEVHSFDESSEMIANAQKNPDPENQKVKYQVANITDVPFKDEFFDKIFAVFVFNYLTIEDSEKALKEIYRTLKPGGQFLLSLPHPAYAFVRKPEPPFFFEVGEDSYFSARNKRCYGEIHCIDGKQLKVQMVHKTVADMITAISEAGFKSIPKMKELTVTDEIEKNNPTFFAPLKGMPLHYILQLEK